MNTISQSEFDKLADHTIRIELMGGLRLVYNVSVEAKTSFLNLLKKDAVSEYEKDFLWFSIPKDRLVLVNKKEIIRITFCFDPGSGTEPDYFDNFNVTDSFNDEPDLDDEIDEIFPDDELYLPQLIIAHKRKKENTEIVKGVTMKTEGYFGNISSYSNLNIGDVEGFNFDYQKEEDDWRLICSKYLQFIDNDGEQNFMPLSNLSVIEIERKLIMSDETLELYLERNSF